MMCEREVDENVEYLLLECEKYERARGKMSRVAVEGTGMRECTETIKRVLSGICSTSCC